MWRKVLSVILSVAMLLPGTSLLMARRALACSTSCNKTGGNNYDDDCPCKNGLASHQPAENVQAPAGKGIKPQKNKVNVDGSPCGSPTNTRAFSVGVPASVEYAPGNASWMPGLPPGYASIEASFSQMDTTGNKLSIHLGSEVIEFIRADANSPWRYFSVSDPGPDPTLTAGPYDYVLVPAQGDTLLAQPFDVKEKRSGLPKTFTFHGLGEQGAVKGRLWKITQAGQTLEYTHDAQGRVSVATDAYGRPTYFFYNGAGYIEYIVGCAPAIWTNLFGPVTKFIYNGAQLTEVWEGTMKWANMVGDYTNAENYNWKKTLYWFDGSGKLKYEVGPEQYANVPANPTDSQVAALARTSYFYDENGRVSQMIGASCASCGGSLSGGVKYAYPATLDDLCPGTNPTDRNAPTKQMNVQHLVQPTLGGAVTWYTDEKVQTNAAGQVVFELKVMNYVDGTTDLVLITRYVFHSTDDAALGRLEYTYYYEGTLNNIEGATLKRVEKNEFDANGFVQYLKVSPDGTTWTTKGRWDRNSAGQVTAEYVYKDNNTPYETDYTYDANGRLTQTQEPTVTVNLDKAGGQNYRPTTTYTYTTWGDVDTVTDPTGIVRKYYYGYNDPGQDTHNFNCTKMVVDYGDATHLNLTTTYTWQNVFRQWQMTSMTDARGKTWTYTPDSWKRVMQVTSPLGYATNYTYDLDDHVLTVEKKDPSANTLSKAAATYDVFGNVLMAKQYADATNYYATCFRRDNGGHLREVWNRVYNAAYDGTNDPTGDKYGDAVKYTYQHTTDLIAQVDQGAHATAPVKIATCQYDIFGEKTKDRLYRNDDSTYNDVDYTYDFEKRLTSIHGPGDLLAVYSYDERDFRLLATQEDYNAPSIPMTYTEDFYDEAGRVYKTSFVNPGHQAYSRVTNYYRDQAGRLCRTTDPGSHSTDYAYDTAGRPIQTTDPLGNVALYTLDPLGNRVLTTVKHKLDATPTWRTERMFAWLDDDGKPDTVANFGTNSPGQNWNPPTEPAAYNYTNWPAKPTASDSDKLIRKYAYGFDATNGQYVEVTDAAGTATRSFSDLLGRTTRTVEDYGTGAQINRATTYTYDQLDTDYYDSITAKNGTEADQVTKYWHADGVSASRVTKVTYPDDVAGSDSVTYSFRRDGVPNTKADQRGWTTTYTVDAAGRITQEALSGQNLVGTQNVRTTYDTLGRVTEIKDDNGKLDGNNQLIPDYSKVTYSYVWATDSANMTVTETNYLAGSQTGAVTSVYNSDGERTKLTYPNSRYVTYSYDDGHRLYQISDDSNPAAVLAEYDYKGGYLQDRKLNSDAFRLTYKDQNDLDGYDAFGRPVLMHHYSDAHSATIEKLAYDYDYVGTPKYQQDLVNASSDEIYGTDTLHRLTSFKRGTLNQNKDGVQENPALREQSWTLQPLGNWSSVVSKTNGNNDSPYETRAHNTVNEITAITPQGQNQFSVTSDAAGNMSVLPDRTDTTKADRYTYDYRNRLIKAEHSTNYDQETPTWSTVVEYLYDGLNRRVKKDLPGNGVDVIFLYDGWRCIEERQQVDGNWQAVRQFVFGGLYLDEVLIFDKDENGDGNCTDDGGSTRLLYAANNNFNIIAVTGPLGGAWEVYQYDPYGACTIVQDSQTGNPYRFQGQRLDSETGLYYFKNRYYSPALGRFLQRDPQGYFFGMSLYLGISACSIASLDPLGEGPIEPGPGTYPGTYVNVHQSGTKYVGYSGVDVVGRAAESASDKVLRYNDPLSETIIRPAATAAEALKDEAWTIHELGGPNSPNLYNQINSPGDKLIIKEGGKLPSPNPNVDLRKIGRTGDGNGRPGGALGLSGKLGRTCNCIGAGGYILELLGILFDPPDDRQLQKDIESQPWLPSLTPIPMPNPWYRENHDQYPVRS